MSDTPRTDSVAEEWSGTTVASPHFCNLARQLERELAKANELLDLARRHPYIPPSLAQILNDHNER